MGACMNETMEAKGARRGYGHESGSGESVFFHRVSFNTPRHMWIRGSI